MAESVFVPVVMFGGVVVVIVGVALVLIAFGAEDWVRARLAIPRTRRAAGAGQPGGSTGRSSSSPRRPRLRLWLQAQLAVRRLSGLG